VHIINCRLAY